MFSYEHTFHITDTSCYESSSDQWILITKGQ